MPEKKHTYKSEFMALPPLTMVLGDVPDPDPSGKRRLFRAFSEDKTETDVKNTVAKLIGYLKKDDK
ncbi:MAG: hypothetical protein NT121_07645 [Chloroflexi bacterium]|nr:hypothetical protein [Chloroflexota bacterium]